jgi:hypothetical protein
MHPNAFDRSTTIVEGVGVFHAYICCIGSVPCLVLSCLVFAVALMGWYWLYGQFWEWRWWDTNAVGELAMHRYKYFVAERLWARLMLDDECFYGRTLAEIQASDNAQFIWLPLPGLPPGLAESRPAPWHHRWSWYGNARAGEWRHRVGG